MSKSTTLILTCAGKSQRFQGFRPKWSLTHPSGEIMAWESARLITGASRRIAAFNASDMNAFGAMNIADELHGDYEVVCVGDTPNPVETITNTIKISGISGPFVVKDCDNQFSAEVSGSNGIASSDLMVAEKINAANKSYLEVQPDGSVSRIADRGVISGNFCCGAYSFDSTETFLSAALCKQTVPQVVAAAMAAGARFKTLETSGYIDWGTAEDWLQFKAKYKTLFVDVDGVLCGSSHRSFHPRWGYAPQIKKNVDYLNKLSAGGFAEIILTTSRPESARAATENQMSGLKYTRLLMGLMSCQRGIVNDFNPAVEARSCFAVNLSRDCDNLGKAVEASQC